ncbi:MAG: hypothetical protein ABIL16_05835 [candidate division WOR-3 bacterium]
MPVIHNMDSSINVPMDLYNDVVNRLTYLIMAWHKITEVITVNESTMDQVCPPSDGLSEECVKDIMQVIESRMERGEHISSEELDRMLSRCKTKIVNLGCYTNGRIYLCPERIWKYQNPESVFKFVLIHELTHAYLDAPNHKYRSGSFPDYYKVIEESLCEATAYYHMRSEISKLSYFLKNRPGEYAGYYYWLKYPDYAIPHFLDLWKHNDVPIPHNRWYNRWYWTIKDWYYLWRKYGFPFPWLPIEISYTIPPEEVEIAFEEYIYNKNKKPLIRLVALSILKSIE